jgi:pyrroloquinoline quinone biosynthesis protein B
MPGGLSRRGFLGLTGSAALGARLVGLDALARSDLFALVLGSIQDGGLPQAGCYTPRCERARGDPHYVASLAIVEGESGRVWLVDASPDLARQMDLIPGEAFRRRAARRRPFEGILLTHAQSLAIAPTPCYCTSPMAEFVRTNGPWSLMVDEGRLDLRVLTPDTAVQLGSNLEVTAVPVPHRHEFSDTVGFVFRGPRRSLLYLPDIDNWDRWDRPIEDVVGEVDVALLDGSFYSAGEVPGRSLEEIPHPLVSGTMDRLQDMVRAGKKVIFTHLNNTNPVLDKGSRERAEVLRRGFGIARAGRRYPL